ncbi:MAG: hypothetical protein HoeaKO_34720 [Hoeflea alexandrii]
MSSGLRGPYLRAGSLRSFAPASAGACSIGVDGRKGVSREWPEPVAFWIGVQPAESDPHGFEGRPGPRADAASPRTLA